MPLQTLRSLDRSDALQERARKVIPGGSQTLSKAPQQWVQRAPGFIASGEGAIVWDYDGNRYIDYGMGLGPVLLGYCYEPVDRAIRQQLARGITFTLPHALEVDVANRIVDMVPNAEQVRFCKTGSDACAGAVRLARLYTGGEHVVTMGYHGQHDWFMAGSAYSEGIPRALQTLVTAVRPNDWDGLDAVLQRPTAAVIVDPMFAAHASDLRAIVEMAHHYGALVIFDEVVSGFRLAPGGAQEHFDVRADLVTFGKALGNGMPIAAIAGPEWLMKDITFFSHTHDGETLSLAAADAVLNEITLQHVHSHLWILGTRLTTGIVGSISDHGLKGIVACSGLAPCMKVTCNSVLVKSLLQQELAKRGILWCGPNFISYSHTVEQIDQTIRAWDESLGVLADALPNVESRLEGPPIKPVFWERSSA